MKLLRPGCYERTKAAAHVGLGLFAAVCCGYNIAAFILRKEKHLARNAVVYGALVALEAMQVRHHCAPPKP
jgi:hypothetical protein